jgi:hypothetical protein
MPMSVTAVKIVPSREIGIRVAGGRDVPMLAPARSAVHDGSADLCLATEEIGSAWAQYRRSTVRHYRDGIDFGGVCREWQQTFKAQGSRKHEGFERVLAQLGIPKTTAYRWIGRYEVTMRLRAIRNEVGSSKAIATSANSSGSINRIKKYFSFNLFLAPAEERQFEEDLELLGGRRQAADLFLECVSQKALAKRLAETGQDGALGLRECV